MPLSTVRCSWHAASDKSCSAPNSQSTGGALQPQNRNAFVIEQFGPHIKSATKGRLKEGSSSSATPASVPFSPSPRHPHLMATRQSLAPCPGEPQTLVFLTTTMRSLGACAFRLAFALLPVWAQDRPILHHLSCGSTSDYGTHLEGRLHLIWLRHRRLGGSLPPPVWAVTSQWASLFCITC